MHGFGRLELGLGTHGFSANTSLLSDVGYGGVKFWATVDGAYMFHEHIGAGIWLGLNRRTAGPTLGPDLEETTFFIGAQAPILIFGARLFALHVVPRVGFASGQIELDDANGVDAEYQNAVIWGGGITATTFKYHLGTTMGLLRAVVDPPGEAGRDHDFGGLYWTLGGTFDG